MAHTMHPDSQSCSVSEPVQAVTTPEPDPSVTEHPTTTDDDLLEEELLVEEIPIDGMCGVY